VITFIEVEQVEFGIIPECLERTGSN